MALPMATVGAHVAIKLDTVVMAIMMEAELASLLLMLILTLILGAIVAWASLRLTIMAEVGLAILLGPTQLHHGLATLVSQLGLLKTSLT